MTRLVFDRLDKNHITKALQIDATSHAYPWSASALENSLLAACIDYDGGRREGTMQCLAVFRVTDDCPNQQNTQTLQSCQSKAPKTDPKVATPVITPMDSSAASLCAFLLYQCVAGQAEIHHLVCDQTVQRQGIGKQLLQVLVAQLSARSITEVFLEVRASNLAAQGLYRSMGFITTGRRKNYYPRLITSNRNLEFLSTQVFEDALLMQLEAVKTEN